MRVIARFQQFEKWTEYLTDRSGIVTNDGQSATAFGTIRCEHPDDDVTAGPYGTQDALPVTGAIVRIGQEMKGRAVMPYVVGLRRFPGRDIRGDPLHFRASRA